MSTGMRTKNPFCSGAELAVLRTLNQHAVRTLRRTRITQMAQKCGLRCGTFGHALTSLKRAGHITKDAYGHWRLAPTGRVLLACASALARCARR